MSRGNLLLLAVLLALLAWAGWALFNVAQLRGELRENLKADQAEGAQR